jgi:hypothetical protein
MAWDHKEYWILCDESVQDGALFSNFFGGIILPQPNHANLENQLRVAKAEIGFLKELKWQRVTEHWLEGYQRMMTAFFDILREDQARMRVMFRDNRHPTEHLSPEQRKSSYFRLYYQFIKHAFGLKFSPKRKEGTRLRLFFDQFPDTREQVAQFKGFLAALPESSAMREANLLISRDHITEIDSQEHVLLQCVDIVLGAMAFRLNEMHAIKADAREANDRERQALSPHPCGDQNHETGL